jgi:hypothetical protein
MTATVSKGKMISLEYTLKFDNNQDPSGRIVRLPPGVMCDFPCVQERRVELSKLLDVTVRDNDLFVRRFDGKEVRCISTHIQMTVMIGRSPFSSNPSIRVEGENARRKNLLSGRREPNVGELQTHP